MKPYLVVKVGTSTLLDSDERPRGTFSLIADSIHLLMQDYRVVLVTSGSIGFGIRAQKLQERPIEIASLQALSAIGQTSLMRRWEDAMTPVAVAQILVTAREMEHAESIANLEATLCRLAEVGAIPIVNENDTVTFEEITFGDNDMLSARIAALVKAEALVLLTDQDGVYRHFGTARQERADVITVEEAYEHIRDEVNQLSRGGMASKLVTAEAARKAGVACYVGPARQKGAVQAVLSGKIGTKLV